MREHVDRFATHATIEMGKLSNESRGEVNSARTASDAGMAMRHAKTVIVIPGYGLAVAQAQERLYEFVKTLQSADVRAVVPMLRIAL